MEREQNRVIHHNGCALELPNRKQAREPFTREELEATYDKKIEAEAKHWGSDYYYTNVARGIKAKNLSDWDEGKVVQVYTTEYTENCID